MLKKYKYKTKNEFRFLFDNNSFRMIIMSCILFFIILTPGISIKDLPAIRLEQVCIALIVLIWLVNIIHKKRISFNSSRFLVLYLLFSLSIIISIISGSINGFTPVLNDYFEFYKVIIYALTYILFSTFISSDKARLKVLSSVCTFITISSIISFTQYYNLFNLNELYIPIIAPTQYRALMPGYPSPRVVGMSSNPNVYAGIAGFGCIISLWMLIHTREKKYIVFFAINMISNLMTKSRTGFIFCFIGVLLIIINHLYTSIFIKLNDKKSGKEKLIIFFALSLVIIASAIIMFTFILPKSLTWRITMLFDFDSLGSFHKRFSLWENQLDIFMKSPIFGVGPAKQFITRTADNEWILLLRLYGVFGTLLYLTMLLSPLSDKRLFTNKFRHLYYAIIPSIILYMIPAAFYHNFQLMTLFMTIMGIIINSSKIDISLSKKAIKKENQE